MENNKNFNEIAYKKAQKRVKEISNYYWFVIGYVIVAVVLLYKNNGHNIFNFNRDHIVFMLILQGIFLVGYGLYLFVPKLNNWEERKIEKLMKKYQEDGK